MSAEKTTPINAGIANALSCNVPRPARRIKAITQTMLITTNGLKISLNVKFAISTLVLSFKFSSLTFCFACLKNNNLNKLDKTKTNTNAAVIEKLIGILQIITIDNKMTKSNKIDTK